LAPRHPLEQLGQVGLGGEGFDGRHARLAAEIDRLDAECREAAKAVQEQSRALALHAGATMSVDDFVALPRDEKVEEKIRARETDPAALRRADEVRAKGLLQKVVLPNLPAALPDLLSKDLGSVSRGAEVRVRAHVRSCMDHRGEAWIAQGLAYM